MTELIFSTRENTSTYGKPRVYLSFYKTDENCAASELCDEILQISNCAVFMYKDGMVPDNADVRETEMGQMQLFVLVCTPDYLSAENTSRDTEIRFALEHGIPILPVIPEENVIDAFNDLCTGLGIESLHCLDRNEFTGNDNGYREKLKEHLEYFLISDEDTANIREQFRACIFLSYRKKDREYARGLIKRIHALGKYYDVAVWYDDYLVPGRSFEDEIFDAMDRSELFILAVTPNIVAVNAMNEENYVVRKEYPEALKRSKKIVAAELERTDRETLLLKFNELPECIDAYDRLSLEGALTPLDDFEKEDSKAHRYYVGLAYLNGINTEVDPERAFELISSAADEGLEAAMDRLVRMYRSGIAVSRNYDKAIEWQQKLVRLAEDRLREEETAENAHHLIYRLGQLGNYMTEMRVEDGALATYEKLLGIAEKYADKYKLADLYRDVSVSCNKVGDMYLAKKDYVRAQLFFDAGWHAAGVLRDEKPDEVSVRDYAVSCQKLGQVNRFLENFTKAEGYYKEACGILSDIMEEAPSAANIRDVYITKAMLGDVSLRMGDYASAEDYYRDSRDLRETVDRETGADWAKRDISVIWEKLADLYTVTGRKRAASDAYEQAVYTANELFEKTGLPVHEAELSKVCTRAGEFHLLSEEYDEAAYYLQAALEMDEKRIAESDSPEDKRNLSVSYNRLAMMYKDMGENEKAKDYFLKDYKIAKELAKTVGDFDSKRDHELSCNYMGGIYADLGELSEAHQYYMEGIRAGIDLVHESDDPVHWDDLAVLYYNFFRLTRSYDAFRQAYGVWNKLCEEHPENTTYKERLELLESIM